MAGSNNALSSIPEAPTDQEYSAVPRDIERSIQPELVDDAAITGPAVIAHILESFFCLLALVCFASVAGFQTRWHIGVSGLSTFAIILSAINFSLSVFLLLVPLAARKYHRYKPLARWLKRYRVAFVCIGWGTATTFLVAFVTIVSAIPQPGCRDPNLDPHAYLGEQFKKGLGGFCGTKTAGSVFLWCATISWLGTLTLTFREWRRGRRVTVAGALPESPTARLSVELGQMNEQGHEDFSGGDTSTMRSRNTAGPSTAASFPTTRATASSSRPNFSTSNTRQSSTAPQTVYTNVDEGTQMRQSFESYTGPLSEEFNDPYSILRPTGENGRTQAGQSSAGKTKRLVIPK